MIAGVVFPPAMGSPACRLLPNHGEQNSYRMIEFPAMNSRGWKEYSMMFERLNDLGGLFQSEMRTLWVRTHECTMYRYMYVVGGTPTVDRPRAGRRCVLASYARSSMQLSTGNDEYYF